MWVRAVGSAGTDDLTALVGSRICHDLISPLGAICNGLELMQMSGMADSPEMALIAESVDSANARIRFFRIAYGTADRTQMVKSGELQAALRSSFQARQLQINWTTRDMPRNEAKLAFLVLQCLESALPFGGRVSVSEKDYGMAFRASAERVAADAQLWDRLINMQTSGDLRPAQVQFGLLAELAQFDGWSLDVTTGDGTIEVVAKRT